MGDQSTRYAIHQGLLGLLAPVAAERSAVLLYNPPLPAGLQDRGERVLFLLDRGDVLIDQPGQREKRRARVVMGAHVCTDQPDLQADQLHFAARKALKRARTALGQAGVALQLVREVQSEPELKDAQVEGALLLSAYEIEYLETYAD
jgi:hypothetical protein